MKKIPKAVREHIETSASIIVDDPSVAGVYLEEFIDEYLPADHDLHDKMLQQGRASIAATIGDTELDSKNKPELKTYVVNLLMGFWMMIDANLKKV